MATDSASTRPKLSQEQLAQYLDHINLPTTHKSLVANVQNEPTQTQIDFINTLIRHQLCHVPFENLDLHYSPVPGISLDPDFLFTKIVTRASGRGGYCMQNSNFFATVLRTLGFHVTTLAGRVSKIFGTDVALDAPEEVAFGGYGHQITLVTLADGSKYFCDVGFGAAGPTFLVPLVDGFKRYLTGTPENVAASMKLTRGFTANTTNRVPESLLWIYAVKYAPADDATKPWIPTYCFTENEFFPGDFGVMSHWVSTNRQSLFVNSVVCQKFLMAEDGQNLIGDVTLWGAEIKERRFGESTLLRECKTEEDRVDALQRWLGVTLREDEKNGILGLWTALK